MVNTLLILSLLEDNEIFFLGARENYYYFKNLELIKQYSKKYTQLNLYSFGYILFSFFNYIKFVTIVNKYVVSNSSIIDCDILTFSTPSKSFNLFFKISLSFLSNKSLRNDV